LSASPPPDAMFVLVYRSKKKKENSDESLIYTSPTGNCLNRDLKEKANNICTYIGHILALSGSRFHACETHPTCMSFTPIMNVCIMCVQNMCVQISFFKQKSVMFLTHKVCVQQIFYLKKIKINIENHTLCVQESILNKK
jgi:hypothetical protein